MTEPRRDVHHDAYRELISARFDGPLELDPDGELSTHLLACTRCRQFDHDLAEQRWLLRALPPLIPPRDLWARTSAALDRELLRDARRGSVEDGSPRASGRLGQLTNPASVPSVLMVSMASLGMAVALLITQLGPALRLPSDGTAGQQTPFGGPGVALAFVGADEGGLTLYRTRVDQTCPDPTNCDREDEAVAARVTFPASFRPNNLALAPRGDRLAIMGSDNESENVFAVMVVPPIEQLSPDADYPNRPRGSTTPSAPEPVLATPGPGSSVVFVGRTPPPSVPPAGPGATPVIPAELSVSTILDGVYGVGAAPAWSSDGQALAFSAMPSDRSRGPDIYIWRVGDDRAQPITSDHGSYFASWSGGFIVVSRATRDSADALMAAAPAAQTIAIDPRVSEERVVDADGLWLPQIDPNSRRAVAWHGRLAWDGVQVVPTHGALYLLDWSSIDPFAEPAPEQTPDGQDVDLSGTGGDGGAQPSTAGATVAPEAATATDGDGPTPAATAEPARLRASIATDAPTPRPLDKRLTPIEPDRDPLQHPVTDWRALWSADGRVLGLWLGDISPTTVWGHLTVLSVDLQGRLDRATPILGSTLAKRGFNLGTNRVAWVAPLREGAPSGELRLRMWNGDVVNDVRVKPLESTGVVAAF